MNERNFVVRAIERVEKHNWTTPDKRSTIFTRLVLEGCEDDRDTISLHVPYTETFKLGQKFHCVFTETK